MPPSTVKPDWNEWDAIDQRAAALDEIINPSGAYDGPISKAGHQFDHLFRDAGSPPGVNDAMNSNRRNNNLDVRGSDQDPDPDQPNGSVPSAEECARMVEILADGLAAYDDENETSEHNAFMQALAQLIHAHHNSGNGDQYSTMPSSAPPSYNAAPYARLNSSTGDRRRVVRSRNGRASDRGLAADSNSAVAQLNLSSFYKRFPVSHIKFGGNGR
jgi:hypothetical protein